MRMHRKPKPAEPRRRRATRLALTVALASTAVAAWGGPATAATHNGAPNDSYVRHFGRWDTTSPTAHVPGWAGSYLEVGFTGTTVKLQQRSTIDLFASIDGGPERSYLKVSGIVNLTPTP